MDVVVHEEEKTKELNHKRKIDSIDDELESLSLASKKKTVRFDDAATIIPGPEPCIYYTDSMPSPPLSLTSTALLPARASSVLPLSALPLSLTSMPNEICSNTLKHWFSCPFHLTTELHYHTSLIKPCKTCHVENGRRAFFWCSSNAFVDSVVREHIIDIYDTQRCGLGVRSKKCLPLGTTLGIYTGRAIDLEEEKLMTSEESSRSFRLEGPGRIIIGSDHWSSFINHSVKKANVYVDEWGFIRTRRIVFAGDILNYNYGPAFWLWHLTEIDLELLASAKHARQWTHQIFPFVEDYTLFLQHRHTLLSYNSFESRVDALYDLFSSAF